MSWHADAQTLERYATNTLDDVHAYSLEAHLLTCERCRMGVGNAVDRAGLDELWDAIAAVVDAPAPGPVERGLLALGIRQHIARLLAATPSLRISWLGAQAFLLGLTAFSVSVSDGTPRESTALVAFLTVAALLPVAGVAIAYGPGVDPTYEVGLASPMRSFRLLLIRAVAVLGTSIALATVAATAIPGLPWVSAAWLLPSLGLTLATLVASTYVRPVMAAAVVSGTWALVVTSAAYRVHDGLAAFRGQGQVWFVFIIALSVVLLAARRSAFEQGAGT